MSRDTFGLDKIEGPLPADVAKRVELHRDDTDYWFPEATARAAHCAATGITYELPKLVWEAIGYARAIAERATA